jgi:hypothetical protein
VLIAAGAAGASAAIASYRREAVGSDATSPNTSGQARSCAMSARQSPPSVRGTEGRARSWVGRGSPAVSSWRQRLAQRGREPDRLRGAEQQHAASLRYDVDPAPSTVRTVEGSVIFFDRRCPGLRVLVVL